MSIEIKLLIIGKNSFIATNLYNFLKKRIIVKKISFEEFKKKNNEFLQSFSHICNCAITKEYATKKYKKKNDIDKSILIRIKKFNIKYIFLSSRKVYKPKMNIKENSTLIASNNYSKNKIITEKYLKTNFKNKYLILRISNLIGRYDKKYRKVSNTFINNYFRYKKYKKNIFYENLFKDFLSIDQFNHIILKILQKNIKGIYNVSIGKKIFIKELLKALNKGKKLRYFKEKKISSNDSFYLNNDKLKKKIQIKITKHSLFQYCYNI